MNDISACMPKGHIIIAIIQIDRPYSSRKATNTSRRASKNP